MRVTRAPTCANATQVSMDASWDSLITMSAPLAAMRPGSPLPTAALLPDLSFDAAGELESALLGECRRLQCST